MRRPAIARGMLDLSRRRLMLLLGAGAASACSRGADADAPPYGSIGWAVAGPWRIQWRHPLQTLLFWGIEPGMTVLEVLPGLGWYTSILAPFLAATDGRLIAASFDPNARSLSQRETLAAWEARFRAEPSLYGEIERTTVAPPAPLAPAGSVDLAIIANTVHALMAEGIAESVFAGVRDALKSGGKLGVEQHRAASTGLQDPLAGAGYVQEAYVKALAEEAGLEFVGASDVNANPRDTRDHPFGVWTLPPFLRTAPMGEPDNPDFNSAPYVAIGESDRMTLLFRKR